MQQQVNVLEIEGLVKTFENGVRAVDGLTLAVPQGSIFGFLGLNGAGKTTTIRIIAGLAAGDAGAVRLFGREIDPRDGIYKKDVGFVLDEPMYFGWMTPREYLTFAGAMYGLTPENARGRTGDLIAFLDLAEKEDAPIETLSTGMKKKVSLAAAIIHTPRLVVLDEPLEGIDAYAARGIKECLTFMASHGTTVFITSHVLDTVERLCDEVAIIGNGKLLLQCPTAGVRERVRDEATKETYASLEDLFIDTVTAGPHATILPWL